MVDWRWLLPLTQFTVAVFCHLYGPHEYRLAANRDKAVNNMEYFLNHAPPISERISEGVNFPALVVAYPFRNLDAPIYQYNSEFTLIWISLRDLGFLAGVVILWCWIGTELRRSRSSSYENSLQKGRFIESTCGVLFAILVGAYAVQMIASRRPPSVQIGFFGAVWGVLLVGYFIRRLVNRHG